MDSFRLHFMASEHMVYDGDAESVSLMTTEGSIGILAHHSNLIMAVVPGIVEYVPVEETVKGFGAIVSGEMDEYPEQAFFNVGTIDDAIAKAKTL